MAANLTITWQGISCFLVEVKNGDMTTRLLTDPFGVDSGLKLPRSLTADIVTLSDDTTMEKNLESVKSSGEKPLFVVRTPGEYEEGGLFAYGIAVGNTTVYRFEVGDLSFAHLGNLGEPLTDKVREQLEDVDVLMIPVGGEGVLNAKQAVEIITALEPRVVIPMHFAVSSLKEKRDTVDRFLKEIAAAKPEKLSKIKIAKKDLPTEETKIIVPELE